VSDYRKQIATTSELAAWYDSKYVEMGDGWYTPPQECVQHLNDLDVPFNPDLRLLDVGCGAGHFLEVAQWRVGCIGVEISRIGLMLSRIRAERAKIYDVSIEDWVFWKTKVATFDYVVSIGSLEHIVDLDGALDNIRRLLKQDGKFYFYCPNELWKHFDQPNERTMRDDEWIRLFESHGLLVATLKRWNDNTAFIGGKQ